MIDDVVPMGTLRAVRRLLSGEALNGHLGSVHPLFRPLIAALSAHTSRQEQAATLASWLGGAGFTPAQVARFVALSLSVEEDRGRIEVLSRAALRARPKPTWLVEGHIQRKSLACIYGPSGIGKSILALSIGAAVASGRPWFGRAVQQGEVVYIAGEGDDDYDNRLSAWEQASLGGGELAHFSLIPEPFDFRRTETPGLLLDAVREAIGTDPALVVVDTVARNMTGDENSTEHMSAFVRQADVVWRETGATVLLIHHTGKGGEVERGNSALRAGTNTMLKFLAEEDTQVLRLTCDKQKNGRPFAPWQFVLKEVADSVVLDLSAGFKWVNHLPPVQQRALEALGWPMHAGGVAPSALQVALGVRSDTERTNLYRALGKLYDTELAAKTADGRGARYTITAKGRDLLSALAGADPGHKDAPT
jgi:hypothetical protein